MSTRFYAGQQDYIIQLNLIDDEFDAAVGSITGKAESNNGVFTGTTTIPKLFINRTANVSSGIQWYNSTANTWQEYMATGGTTSQGPKGNLTAPTGTLVTGLALRSLIDNTAGNGWTWETNTTAGTTPAIVAEITAAGAAKFAGAVTAASFSGNASSSTYATNTTITNDTTTNATMYVTWVTATSGNVPQKVSSTKLTFNPSTGTLTAPTFSGALSGNATSSTTTAITDDVATAVSVYPMWTTAGTGNLAAKVSTSAFSFVPSTSALTLTGSGATQLTLSRTGSATNTTIALTNTSGTVYAGHGPANTWAVGGAADLNSSNWFRVSATDATTAGNLIVGGNLTINGTTTTVNSTTVTLDDPVLTLGGDTAPTSDDNKDRGIEYRWHNGSVAKLGFFGYDDSTSKFTFIPDATNTSGVYSGTKGTIDADLTGNVTGALTGNADTATKLLTSRTITLTGDVTGSVGFDGSANASITAVVVDDSHNHTISTVTGLQTALDAKFDDTGGVIGNQTTGWADVNAPTVRIVDTVSSALAGGLAIESYRPTIQLIDRTASERSLRIDNAAGSFGLASDDGSKSGTYTSNFIVQPHTGSMVIGGSLSNNVGMYVRTVFDPVFTTSTNQYGANITPEFNELSTANGYTVLSTPRVKDAVFTMGNLYGVSVGTPTIGAQATVTNYDAFCAFDATLTGTPTRIAGLRMRMTSGTNKWNLYADGSASNYLSGNVQIGSTTSTGEKLQVTGTAKFTGDVTITTQAVGDNSTKAASTAFTQQAAADAAIVYSIVFG
jgi:hypothetical protein